MLRSTQSKLAAVLTAVSLLMPSTAMALEAGMAEPAPMPTAPAPAPVREGKGAPVLAETKVTREEAVQAVRKLFPIPADMGEPNIGLSQNQAGASWRLEWSTTGKTAVRKAIMAEVDAVTGVVLRFNRSDSGTESKELTYSRSEAYKIALEWLAKVAGDRQAALRYVDDPLEYGFYGGGSAFRFHWDRMEQGYPVRDDGYDITIDARTGELVSYSHNWRTTAAQFKLPADLLSQAKAYEAYRDNLPMLLQYQRYQKPGTEESEWRLVYRPRTGFWPMVGMEGKLINFAAEPIDFSRFGDGKLVAAPATPYQKPEKPLTPEQALALAKAVAGQKAEPTNVDCNERTGEQKQKVQSCHFGWYNEGDDSNANVEINMITGVVMHYGNWVREEFSRDAKPKITEEQARAMAVEFIRQYRPDLAGKILLMPAEYRGEFPKGMPIRNYYVSFQLLHNLVPINGNGASVEVNAMTGRVQYFYGGEAAIRAGEVLPEMTGLLKSTEAIDAFLKAKGLELSWMAKAPAPVDRLMPGMAEAARGTEMVLVWAPQRNMPAETIGAQTGALYDYSGRDLIQAAMRPTDIEGHAAQREIELLWARGIFELKDGKFNPDQVVSAAELARWLVMARGLQPYVAYDYALNFAARPAAAANLQKSEAAPFFGAALQAGILMPEDFSDDTDPNAPVSREVYALWAVRAMGFADIANMENRIAMPFADQATISAKYYNAVAILNGLKVVRGDASTNFAPKAQVTRGDAAKILFAVASRGRVTPYWK